MDREVIEKNSNPSKIEPILEQENIMQAIEFKSQLKHGQITVPAAFHLAEGQPVRVLILLDEPTGKSEDKETVAESILEQKSGAWQGDPRSSLTVTKQRDML